MLHRMLRRFLHVLSEQEESVWSARRKSAIRRRSQRLLLEVLEDRLVPATLTVHNNMDSGPGSLRDTIAAAASGDTIVFDSSVHAITLTTGQLAIFKSLDIDGPGASSLSISGAGSSRVFGIFPTSGPVSVGISGLTVTDGKEVVATEGDGGGGIYNEVGSTLLLQADVISDCQATTSTHGLDVLGGGLLSKGTATVKNTVFSGNQALNGGSLTFIGGSAGGAIENYEGASLSISNSTFKNNQAISAADLPGDFNFALGGAINCDAGAFNGNVTTTNITNSTFSNNLATGGFGVIGNGGAINNAGAAPGLVDMTLTGCALTGNRCVGGGGGDNKTTGDSEAVGGAILNSGGTLTVTGCTIAGNLAQAGDNAVLSDADPFAGGAFGGGIENNVAAVLHISNSLIANNVARGGSMTTVPGPGGDAMGGGIENAAAFASSQPATVLMTSCLVVGNSALGGHGNAGANPLLTMQAGLGFGGGFDTSHNGSVATIIGSILADNRAIGGAGGAGNSGGDGMGGGLAVGWDALLGITPGGSQLTLTNSLVLGNVALGGSGGAGANGGDGLGGGLVIGPGSSATVSASLFDFNAALGGPAGLGGGNSKGVGGGVYNDLGMFTPDMLTIIAHNFASTSNNNVYPLDLGSSESSVLSS